MKACAEENIYAGRFTVTDLYIPLFYEDFLPYIA